MQIQFYHLIATNFERALPPLLNKIRQADYKVSIKLASKGEMKSLDDWLWSYDPNSFLPHGVEGSDHADQHPIYLTTSEQDRPNSAEILMMTDGTMGEETEGVERILDLFDGNDETSVQAARDRWRHYKEAGHDITYWQQQPGGGWKKAA